MSENMRSIVVYGAKDVKIENFPVPECDDDKILVQVERCGVCTYEQRLFNGTHKAGVPVVPGHEVAGKIVAIGKEINTDEWSVGDTVVVGVTLPCRDCYPCKLGETQNCEHFDALKKVLPGQHYVGTGGFSSYMMSSPECVFKYHSVSPEEACMTEPLSCVIHSVETADPQFGQYCFIIGAGFMGLLHTLLCVRKGTRVIVSDMNEDRLELAKKMGAQFTINPAKENTAEKLKEYTNGHMASVVFDTTPIAAVAEEAFHYLGTNGKLMIYSGIYPNKPITVDPHLIHKKGLQILGTANSNDRDFTRASEMISNGIVDMKPFISGVYEADDIIACLESSCTGLTFRNIVKF